jgi:hypothetical protein
MRCAVLCAWEILHRDRVCLKKKKKKKKERKYKGKSPLPPRKHFSCPFPARAMRSVETDLAEIKSASGNYYTTTACVHREISVIGWLSPFFSLIRLRAITPQGRRLWVVPGLYFSSFSFWTTLKGHKEQNTCRAGLYIYIYMYV